jgi:ferredoxin/flavodoxin---NADP+ reductase
MKHMYELIIIGAGPIGMYAASLASMRKLHTCVLESLPQVGGQLQTFYPEKPIYDIPGFPSIRADAFVEKLHDQLNRYLARTPIQTQTKVTHIETVTHGFRLHTVNGLTYEAQTVLLTTGAGSLTPRRMDVEIDDERIHYQLQTLASYRGLRVVILGGGDTALDYGVQLLPYASKISVVHRRDMFRGMDGTLEQLKGNVQFYVPYAVDHVTTSIKNLTLDINQLVTNQNMLLETDRIIVAYGFQADTSLVQAWQLDHDRGKIRVNTSMQTSREHIWAAGNNVTYEGKAHTIATGFGEVNTALESILKTLRPGKAIVYSSNLNDDILPK